MYYRGFNFDKQKELITIQLSDEQIAQRLQQKDKEIFNYIMDCYNRLLWVIVGNVLNEVGTTEDIEDCITDVYIKLLENPKIYNYKKGSFKSFLVKVAKNHAINSYRKLVRRNTANIFDETDIYNDDDDLLTSLITDESREIIMDAIDSLKEPDKEIIIRRYLFNEKVKIISDKMNLQPKKVENTLFQGKMRLKNILINEGL
jgi:RNA polymerase sigma-70 factor (ECF subfamily)